ncbi:MAG TPA: CHASE3 domain-containing protein, partial [Candidatus Acidoferrales bacterium]|nr:CHASE3 domain-containing protein [Candidatus Acidoferrales bacterium]
MKSKTDTSGSIARRSGQQVPWLGFCVAVVILVLIALAADDVTTRLEDSQYWLNQTQEVEQELGRLRGDLLAAESARLLYLITGNETRLNSYYSGAQRIPEDLDLLKNLTADNPIEQQRLAELRPIINQRMGLLKESIELRKVGPPHSDKQDELTITGTALSNQAMDIVQNMRDSEDNLLKQRESLSRHTYGSVRLVLAIAFCAVVIIFAGSFRRLWVELHERRQAEEAVRKLNGRILQVQDEERRKVARELHDSIGQVLAALKMNLSLLDGNLREHPEQQDQLLIESRKLIDQGISEARTLSHLLHPPLLDEMGFASAARWLVDGFSGRSNIQVHLEMPPDLYRMPGEIELTLFRVLQESLTNIHRHSGSSTADILLERAPGRVMLTVR